MADYHLVNVGCRALDKNEQWKLNNPNVNRLYYIIDGSGYYKYQGGNVYFKPGYVYIIPSKFEYIPDWDREVGFKHLYFDFLSVKIFGFDKPICFKAEDNVEAFLNAFINFFKKCDERVFNKFKYQKEITNMFSFLMMQIEKMYNISYVEDERIERILDYIHKNYDKELSVKEMADYMYLNKSYFSKLFTKSIGMSPHEYLINYRLVRGLELLKKGISVQNAAIKVGYKTVNSFSAAMKKYTGNSPRANIKNYL